MSLDLVIARLQNAGCNPARRGDQYESRCPAHDDRVPSLSVTEDFDGHVLVHCFAGCEFESILAVLGLEAKDLMPETEPEQGLEEIAHYPYTNEDGELLYEVVRFVPKTFRQRRPDGNGGWLWNMDDMRRVLYRLPDVIEARDNGQTIWVVEGEKDADTLTSKGVYATTLPGGAGKWRSEYTTQLAGAKKVIIVADADDPGRKHARTVADALLPHVKDVGIVEPAEGCKDATDHFLAGHSMKDFKLSFHPSANAATHSRAVRLVSAQNVRVRPVRWIWERRFPAGSLSLLAGREGIGKSSVAYDVAASLTRGVLPGCCYGMPRTVIVAATEDSWEHTIAPRLIAAKADLGMVFRIEVEAQGTSAEVVLPVDLDELVRVGRDAGAALLLLDPLLSRLSNGLDTHKDAEVRRALEPLVRASAEADWATVGIIHLSKAMTTDPLTQVMGSRAFTAVARSVLYVTHHPDTRKLRLLAQIKNNLGQFAPSIFFTIEGRQVAVTDEGPVWSSHVCWGDETTMSVQDVLEGTRSAVERTFGAVEEIPATTRRDLQ
jgi:AAA domain